MGSFLWVNLAFRLGLACRIELCVFFSWFALFSHLELRLDEGVDLCYVFPGMVEVFMLKVGGFWYAYEG